MTESETTPHSREIEQAVLGAMLTDPECIADVTPFLKDSSVFYLRRHRMIYDAICELYSAGSAVDILFVFEQLQSAGKPAEAGGISYLAECSAQALGSASVMQHCRILVEHHLRRQGAGVCRRALKAFESGNHTASDIVDRLNNDLLQITDRLTGSYKIPGWEELIAEIEWCMANRGKPVGISSGYPSLDRIIRGFEDGEYILLAGRPSMGKTNFMLNLARHLDKRNVPAGILSLESTTRKLRTRMLCQHGRYNVYDFTDAKTGDEYFNGVLAKVSELTSANITMVEAPGISIPEIRSRAVSLKRKHGIKILFIDHLGEIFVESESMYVKTTKVSTQLRALALDLKIPLVALCQLSRIVATRENKRPVLSDLRDSGALEQQADKALFLHRPNYYLPFSKKFRSSEGGSPENMEVIVAKHRDGKTGLIDLKYYEEWGLIEEYQSEEERATMVERCKGR